MIRYIMKKELLDNLLSFRFYITVLLCVILIPLGIFVGLKEYENRLADYNQSLSLYRDGMQGTLNPQEVKAKGLRPPSPFSIFSDGLDRFLPNEVISTRRDGIKLANQSSMDSPLSILFGKIDFLFSISIVMSLLAILFTFDAATREKEQGTFRLAFSNAVPKHHVLLGKYFGNFFSFLIPFVISIIVGLLILSQSGAVSIFEGDTIVRLFLIVIISLLFISLFFNLGLLVSVLNHRSLTSQITLLFLWVLFIFAVPRISGMIAEVVYPVKTQQTINLEKALVRKNIEDEKAATLKDFFLRSQDDGYVSENYDTIRRPIVDQLREKERQQLESIETEYRNNKNYQLKIASVISRLSPLSALTYAVTELSNTGIQEMDNLFHTAQQFHHDVTNEVHTLGYKDEIPGVGMRMNFGKWISFEDIPQFQFNHIPVRDNLQVSWLDILLLVIFNLLFFAISFVGILRYDVR